MIRAAYKVKTMSLPDASVLLSISWELYQCECHTAEDSGTWSGSYITLFYSLTALCTASTHSHTMMAASGAAWA